jgi:predicted TIM-barrel fold metal-dependent hydrolase
MEISIVDAWANPAFPLAEGLPEVARLFMQSGSDDALISKRRTPTELVSMMDDAGVRQICICAWYRPGKVVFSNAEVAEFTRAYPDRFIGIAGCDLLNPVEAVKELKNYVTQEGFKGLRVVPWLWGLPPNDKHYWPLYVECITLDIPFVSVDLRLLKISCKDSI